MGPSVAHMLLLTATLLLGAGSVLGWLPGLSGVGVARLILLGVLVIAVVVAAVIVVVIWRAIRRDWPAARPRGRITDSVPPVPRGPGGATQGFHGPPGSSADTARPPMR
jgi:hypothetical protein